MCQLRFALKSVALPLYLRKKEYYEVNVRSKSGNNFALKTTVLFVSSPICIKFSAT